MDQKDILIITQSCKRDRDNGWQDVCRETWAKTWGNLFTHKIALGEGNTNPADHELILPVPDDYASCPFKTQAAIRWGQAQGFKRIFHTTVDTYVFVPHVLRLQGSWPYVGARCDEGHASGGAGYYLEEPAIGALADSVAHMGYEDMWVGQTLAKQGIPPLHNPHFHGSGMPWPPDPELVSVHLGLATGVFNPDRMYEAHDYMLKFFC